MNRLDVQVGRIMAALDTTGKRANTIVIFSSDHGLALGSHGLLGKANLYEHSLNVPLFVCGPGIKNSGTRTAQVQLSDLYPTICELVGIDVPAALAANSFAPVLQRRSETARTEIFGYVANVQRAIRTDRFNLIVYPQIGREQLFDLQHDPDEMHDLVADPAHSVTRAKLRSRLQTWQCSVRDPEIKVNLQ